MFGELKAEFEKANPDITVKYLPAYKEYEDAAQTALRGAVTRQLPDVSLQAINLQRLFVDRKIAVELSPFIAKEQNWEGQGFAKSMMALSTYGDKPYGLAFAASTPIIYINDDLVTKAGGDPAKFPTTWDGIFELSQKIAKLGDGNIGLFHSWAITGNWMWQALVYSHGGRMMSDDEKTVAFDQDAGKKSIALLGRMVREGGMPDLTPEASRAAFFSGKLGIWTESTSLLRVADEGVAGKFKWRTVRLPGARPRRQAADRRRGGDDVRHRSGAAGGGVEVHDVHHRRAGRHDHGQGHRLHAAELAPGQRSGDAEDVLRREAEPPDVAQPAAADDGVVRLPGREQPQDHPGDQGPPADGGRQVGRAGGRAHGDVGRRDEAAAEVGTPHL